MGEQMKNKKFVNYIHILAVPWCCIFPLAVALFGLATGTLGVFLMQLTPLFFIISVLLIVHANYNVWLGKFRTTKHRVYVLLITLFSIVLWTWSIFIRMGFGNFLGGFGF